MQFSHGQTLVLDAIDRIEAVAESETAALRQFKAIDLNDFNNRKSQLLLEMTRAIRALGGQTPDAAIAVRLSTLRDKLAANQSVLATHLKAAREITSLVAETIRDSESDGTYTNALSRTASPW